MNARPPGSVTDPRLGRLAERDARVTGAGDAADDDFAAFDPAHFVAGIGPSPDKMLQGRLFAYGGTHGTASASTTPSCPSTGRTPPLPQTTATTGFMRLDENHGADKNHGPNSHGGPQQSDEPLYGPLAVSDATGTHE